MSSQEAENEEVSSFMVINPKTDQTIENDTIETSEDNIVPSNRLVLQTANELESELVKFRNEWREELKKQDTKQEEETSQTSKSSNKSKNIAQYHQFPVRNRSKQQTESTESNDDADLDYEQPQDNEQKAQYLFNKGVLLEQQGRHFEAIKFYRMSMQLDADIEFKIASNRPSTKITKIKDDIELNEENKQEIATDTPRESAGEFESLYDQFQAMTLNENCFCEKNSPQKATHFSQLPLEVIMLVLKWVVSSHLDMRSLDSFSAVCKGFYVCGRDPELWKLACSKIWGAENITNYLSTYDDYRSMFLKRPRLNFDGVYISKTSYARAGEQSLDNFYQPWHLVEYFRYMRFFSDGSVIFLTTPDEPKITVAKLKNKAPTASSTSSSYHSFIQNEHSILRGTWTLAMDKVSIVLCKKVFKPKTNVKYSKRQNNKDSVLVDQDQIYRIEMELTGRSNTVLNWTNYEIQIINKLTNTKSSTKFDLNKVDFPSLYYSRVKSYSLYSDGQLK